MSGSSPFSSVMPMTNMEVVSEKPGTATISATSLISESSAPFSGVIMYSPAESTAVVSSV